MNKIIILIGVLMAIFLVNLGLSLNGQAVSFAKEIEEELIQNNHMGVEILKKQQLTQESPVSLSKAYGLVINNMRYLEGNSGTAMSLMIAKSQDNEDIAIHYVDSQYRGIKKLPIIIQVDKFSSETDMGAVLNDIYQLESQTDFKATEINKEGDAVIVKGDIYGI